MKTGIKVLLLLIVTVFAVLFWLASNVYQSQYNGINVKPLMPLTFAHVDHKEQRCVDCHHNFEDDTGQGLCFNCHQTNSEVAHLMEQQFHKMCRGCHMEKQREGEESGPIRICGDCHQADFLP